MDRKTKTVVSLRHRLEYAAARGFAALVRLVGMRAAYFLARRAGDLLHAVARGRVRTGRDNLRERYTDAAGRPLSERDVRRLTRECFRHMVCEGVELLRLSQEIARRGLEDIVRLEGRENMEAAVARGKGVIVVSGHIGNPEIMGACGMAMGLSPTSVYRPLDNPLLEAWVRGLRGAGGQNVVSKRGAVLGLIRVLRRGGVTAIQIDQDARRHGIFVPYFGVPASTTPTPAQLAMRTGAAIIPAFSLRTGPGFRYRLWFEEPMVAREGADGEEEMMRIMTELNRRLESAVRQDPSQWLWLHRRWKTTPERQGGGR